jgi:hypothetical protein
MAQNTDRLQSLLERREKYLTQGGCDFDNLQDYFGYQNTPNSWHRISMKRDPTNNTKYIVDIKRVTHEHDILDIYFAKLPREINNLVYMFLFSKTEIKISIQIPPSYPFDQSAWNVLLYAKNGKDSIRKRCMEIAKNKRMFCEFSPTMFLEKAVHMYLAYNRDLA